MILPIQAQSEQIYHEFHRLEVLFSLPWWSISHRRLFSDRFRLPTSHAFCPWTMIWCFLTLAAISSGSNCLTPNETSKSSPDGVESRLMESPIDSLRLRFSTKSLSINDVDGMIWWSALCLSTSDRASYIMFNQRACDVMTSLVLRHTLISTFTLSLYVPHRSGERSIFRDIFILLRDILDFRSSENLINKTKKFEAEKFSNKFIQLWWDWFFKSRLETLCSNLRMKCATVVALAKFADRKKQLIVLWPKGKFRLGNWRNLVPECLFTTWWKIL